MNEPQTSTSSPGIRRWMMSGLGSGYAPVASGTFGSGVALVIALACWGGAYLAGQLAWLDFIWLLLVFLASAGCVRWGEWAVEYYANRSRKPGDPGMVVIDEFAGQWLSLVAIPMQNFDRAMLVLACQFFLFRLFDVIKPPPARQLERLPLGWGILCDDLAAAVYANIVGQIIFRVIWPI